MQTKLEKFKNCWPYIIIFLCSLIMIGPQLYLQKTIVGADTNFHFARFFETAMQIRTGNFSLFQTNYAFHQSGRIINALYGPGFAYLNGMLLLLCRSWFNYQVLVDILLIVVGAGSMLHLLNWLKVNKVLATTFSLIYVNMGMIPSYLFGTTFNGWGQALMPLVLLCGIRMITQKQQINYLQLGVIMALMAQIHMLSTLLSVILLIPFFICGFIKSNNKQSMIIELVKAVLLFLVLTANVWGSLLVLSGNKMIAPDRHSLVASSLYIGHKASKNYFGIVKNQIPIVFLAIIVLQILYVAFNRKKNRLNLFLTSYAVILLLIMSPLFPWRVIQQTWPILRRNFQFVYRLETIAYPLLVTGVALSVQEIFAKYSFKKVVLGLAALSATILLGTTFRNDKYFAMTDIVSIKAQMQMKETALAKYLTSNAYGNMVDYLPLIKHKKSKKLKKIYSKKVQRRYHKYQHQVVGDGLRLKWDAKKE